MKTEHEILAGMLLDKFLSNSYYYLLNHNEMLKDIIQLNINQRNVLYVISLERIDTTKDSTEYNICYHIILYLSTLIEGLNSEFSKQRQFKIK